MDINKTHWNIHNDQFRLTMPISKIDKENRIVSGFATLNNLDKQGDVVDAAASRKAFKEWAGNVRLMHDRVPAGKAVDIVEKQVTDEVGTVYDGMWVDVYISKGAPNVWEMVLDETLRAFSIGGSVNKYEMQKQDGDDVRYITDYTLSEVSLVDNPANHMATIMSIQKSDDGVKISSIYSDQEVSESSVTIKEEETTMTLLTKIWAAVRGGTNKVEEDLEKAIVQPNTSTVVQPDKRDAAETKRNADGVYIGTKGGSDLGTIGADNPGLLSVDTTDAGDSAGADTPADVAATDVEKPEKHSKHVKKSDDELTDSLTALTANVTAIAEVVEKLAGRLDSLETIQNNNAVVTKSLDEIVGRLKAVEKETAQKQSGDIAKSTVVTPRKQSFWDGAILNNSDL